MNEKDVRIAAEKAEKLAASVKGDAHRNAVFAVLFQQMLNGTNEMSKLMPHSKTAVREKTLRVHKGKAGPMERVRELVADGFFKNGRGLNATLTKLTDRGYGYDAGIIGKVLQRLCRDRVLRRKKGKEGKRTVYLYTNW